MLTVSVSKDDTGASDGDTEAELTLVEEEEAKSVVFDFYVLTKNVDLVTVDLASMYTLNVIR
jgi:hypothetical protein